jgi:hypothetical protein
MDPIEDLALFVSTFTMPYKKKHSLSSKIFLTLNSIQLDTKIDVTIRVMGKYPVLWNRNDFFTVPDPDNS